MADSDDDRWWYWVAGATIVAVAALMRIPNLGTTLFEDEVWVADLVRDGGLRPHSYNAPPLFYALERLWVAIRGLSDPALRSIPLCFGVALPALPLAAERLAPGLTDRTTRFAWAVLLAFSSPLFYYATRIKQYTLEAFVSALLALLFFGALAVPTRARVVAFFATATVTSMVLVTPIFTIAAAGAVLLTTPLRRSWLFLTGFAATGAAFAGAYFGWLAPGPETTRLHGDMDEWFTMTGRWMNDPAAIVPATSHWIGQAFNLTRLWWVVVPLLVVWWLVRGGNWRVLLFAAAPPAMLFAASVVHVYPYGEVRLMSFAYPAVYLVAAAALAHAARAGRTVVSRAVLLLLVPFAFGTDVYDRTYMRTDDLSGMYAFLARNADVIYADRSRRQSLHHHYPTLDVRPMPGTPAAGWYVQAGPPPAEAEIVMQVGEITAARVMR